MHDALVSVLGQCQLPIASAVSAVLIQSLFRLIRARFVGKEKTQGSRASSSAEPLFRPLRHPSPMQLLLLSLLAIVAVAPVALAADWAVLGQQQQHST